MPCFRVWFSCPFSLFADLFSFLLESRYMQIFFTDVRFPAVFARLIYLRPYSFFFDLAWVVNLCLSCFVSVFVLIADCLHFFGRFFFQFILFLLASLVRSVRLFFVVLY